MAASLSEPGLQTNIQYHWYLYTKFEIPVKQNLQTDLNSIEEIELVIDSTQLQTEQV